MISREEEFRLQRLMRHLERVGAIVTSMGQLAPPTAESPGGDWIPSSIWLVIPSTPQRETDAMQLQEISFLVSAHRSVGSRIPAVVYYVFRFLTVSPQRHPLESLFRFRLQPINESGINRVLIECAFSRNHAPETGYCPSFASSLPQAPIPDSFPSAPIFGLLPFARVSSSSLSCLIRGLYHSRAFPT